MPYANISAALSPADIIAINAAFDTIFSKLPFLIELTPKERRTLYKMGPDAKSYVDKTKDYAVTYPRFIPPFKPVGEFNKDWQLWTDLAPLAQRAAGLASGLLDTQTGLGHEEMMFMKGYYGLAQEGEEQGEPGASVVVADLGQFYDRPDRPGDLPPDAETP